MGGRVHHFKTYQSWSNMKTRCYNPKATHFKNYGARGIIVCERWKIASKTSLRIWVRSRTR